MWQGMTANHSTFRKWIYGCTCQWRSQRGLRELEHPLQLLRKYNQCGALGVRLGYNALTKVASYSQSTTRIICTGCLCIIRCLCHTSSFLEHVIKVNYEAEAGSLGCVRERELTLISGLGHKIFAHYFIQHPLYLAMPLHVVTDLTICQKSLQGQLQQYTYPDVFASSGIVYMMLKCSECVC